MQTKFMQRAIELASKNVTSNKGGPFGAVIVKNDKIIAEGTNLVTSKNDPTAHAEVGAIREACQKLNTFHLDGCEIYASCEPCPMCLAAIYWARINKIYYAATKEQAAKAGFDDAFFYKEIRLPKDKRKIPMEQLLNNESINIFEDWINSTCKVIY